MMGFWGRQWHQLDHMQTICTLLQTDNHTNTSSLDFYMPDKQCQSTETCRLVCLCVCLSVTQEHCLRLRCYV